MLKIRFVVGDKVYLQERFDLEMTVFEVDLENGWLHVFYRDGIKIEKTYLPSQFFTKMEKFEKKRS
ncbi:MAG: hypothetical protein FWC41_11390 [Firmicutes bacterium]|nr:hypothetical protein [Bacillota bacterium]